jgi:MYXO-CTERM domain-containing protein
MKIQERPTKMVRRPSLLLWSVFGLGLFATTSALAAEYYVSPTGSDSNPGTQASPWGTVQKAADTAVAGDTVWLRGGTYAITTPNTGGSGITFSKSGTSDTNRINYFAYAGEVPKIDFSNMKISTSGYTMGITVSGNWLHFKGIEECCTTETTFANNGWDVSGSNDIFELLNMHNNQGNGIFMGTKSGGGNLILNCDGHDNYDPTTSQGQGQNADGFGVHYQASGATTILRGNRSWWNSDDCYDLINQEIPVTVEGNWGFGCGYANYGTFNPSSGNGNCFKMGSSKTGIRHLVQNNVAWKCKASGFYANHSSGGNTWYNNTSLQNGTQYNMLASPPTDSSQTIILTGTLVHIMRNNIGFPNKNANMTGVDTQFNTWDLNITPAAKDFLSITDPTIGGTGQAIETTSPALGPRQADGSLPNVDFMKLAAGSAMIDKGTDVGLPFVGAAPDLGAYEYGAVGAGGSTGAGGAVGTGGTSGNGGAPGAGGTTGAGGKTGAGGLPAVGGLPAAGGASAAGGAVPIGGTPGSGGTTVAASGGRSGTGGTSVVVGTGGSVAEGGAVAAVGGATARTGGTVAMGGAIGTGGSVSTGGASSTPAGTGGAVATGGSSANTATQGTGTAGGCSCRLAQAQSANYSGFALFALLMFALRLRKRR